MKTVCTQRGGGEGKKDDYASGGRPRRGPNSITDAAAGTDLSTSPPPLPVAGKRIWANDPHSAFHFPTT